MQQNMMGHNIFIMESSSNLRTLGRNALSGKWKLAILAYILFTLCVTIPTAIFDNFFGTNIGNPQYGYEAGISADTYSQISNTIPEYSPVSGIYAILVSGAFALGITIFFLALFRKQEVRVSDIFLGFECFGKALGLLLYQALFIILWSLIGIVVIVLGAVIMSFSFAGGMILCAVGFVVAVVLAVIASIKYGQSYYVMADNPDKSIKDCVNISKIMMKGNKAKYFFLTLSFIGWTILASIPMGIVIGVTSVMVVPDAVYVIIEIIAGLFVVPVEVYLYSTITGFYEILAGHLIKETEPAPIESDVVSLVPEKAAEDLPENVEEDKNAVEAEVVAETLPEDVEADGKAEETADIDGVPVVPHEQKTFSINARDILEHKDEE